MVHMRANDGRHDEAESSRLRSVWIDGLADALAVTDSSGKVLMSNPAFMRLCHATDPASIIRRSLTDLLGDRAHTLATVLQTARRQGLAHADPVFSGHPQPGQAMAPPGPATSSAPSPAPTEAWSVSAVLLHVGDQECLGVRLRKLHAVESLSATAGPVERLAHAINQLGHEMGLLPLPELLQQVTTLAERHLLSQALMRSAGRLTEAGQLLGIPVTELQQRMQHLGVTGPMPALGGPPQDDPLRQ
jgi:transcriptional regulator with PAS, ATPase and Fis domain